MVAARLTSALVVGLLATSAGGAERSGTFAVSVQVVRPLSVRTAGVAVAVPAGIAPAGEPRSWTARIAASASAPGGLPVALISAGAGAARPCDDAGECRATWRTAAAGAPTDHAVVLTLLPDGAPTAIVDR